MANEKKAGIYGELYNGATKILGLKDIRIDDSAQSVDVTDHDSGLGYGETMPTFKSVRISCTGYYLGDTTTGVQETGQAALRTAYGANTVLSLEVRPVGTGTGKAKETYSCRISSMKKGLPVGDAITWDLEFVGIGAPVYSTQ